MGRQNDEYQGTKYGLQPKKKWKPNGKNGRWAEKRLRERRWMTYEAAALTVRLKSKAGSRMAYFRWHDEYKPVGIPKNPQRVWKEEWEGWNTFLGVDNTFDGYDRAYGQAYDWMDFWEAVKYVQGLGLGSKMEYLREHRAGNIPKNIPMSPDTLKLWNDKWRGIGWKGWLGKSLTGHIEAIRNVEKIVCVCNVSDYEPNMLEVVVAVGLLGLEEIKEREDLSIRKMYLLEDGDEEILRYVLKMGSKQGKDLYMFSNVNEFLYEMDNSLLMYRKL